MARAFKCDRCGKFVQDIPTASLPKAGGGFRLDDYDVCDDCYAAYSDFLGNRKPGKDQLDSVYNERNQLVAALSKVFPSHLAVDPNEPDWPVVCVHIPCEAQKHLVTPDMQVTWHVSKQTAEELFNHLNYEPNHYDGHTTEEKYKRLRRLSR